MKKKILFMFLLFMGVFYLVSCFNTEKVEYFSISASANEYLLEKKNDNNYSLQFSIDQKNSNLNQSNASDVVYYIDGDNLIDVVMVNNRFTAIKEGKVKVSAKIGDLISSNSIEITSKYSSSYITLTENDIAKNLEELSKKTIDFGAIVDIGIKEEYADKYQLIGCDDVMFINESGKLEVCGVMLSTEVKLHSDVTNQDIWTGDLSSTFGTILATAVKNELIDNNVISKNETMITKNHMAQVKKLNLNGMISNDVTSINGLKWLTSLEELDLSNNGIDNIDFASNAKNLKKLIVNNNNISTLEKLKEHRGIEYLDISDNLLNNLDYVHRFTKLKYLDLSSNNIEDIKNVSNLVNVESLFLNDNKLKNFKDALAALNNLKELGLGHCGLTFTDIKSIKFIDKSNITYLDFSGTSVNLNNVVEFRNLEKLILQDTNLSDGADISKLNELTKLKYLDISSNFLNTSNLCESNNGVLKFKLDPNSLKNLETLCLGENEFSKLPDLTGFTNLNTLDLTNAYNLTSLDSIGKLNIKELILDECNSIKINDDGTSYLNALSKTNLPNLEKLSIVSGLNYMTKDLYEKLTLKVKNGELKLRFINDDYIDNNTIYNYTQSIYFTMDDFLNSVIVIEDEKTKINSQTEEVVLSLVNDRSAIALKKYCFYIPSSIKKISIYGNQYDTYDMSFNVMDRKKSSITFDLTSFSSSVSSGKFIESAAGARININTYLNCSIKSSDLEATIDA